MRTTIDLPDELFRRVKARAALDGLKLKDLIARYVEQGLAGATPPPAEAPAPPRRRGLGALPVMIPATGTPIPALSAEELHQIEVDEDVARHERSLGR
ncbi:MAG: hypothetical protein AB7R89_17875 [Dehalococcoidia bacterium]